MISLRFKKPPVGKPPEIGGSWCGTSGRSRKKFFLMRLGIAFLGLFLTTQPLSVKAKALSCPRPHYEDGIPDEIRDYCEEIGYEYGICPEILEAMAYEESRFLPEVSNGKCYGLMQVNVKVHADRIAEYYYTPEDMFDAYKCLVIAADYLKDLYEMYGDENPIVLAVYSGNWKAVNTYKEYGFLCPYAERILTRSAEYEREHGK